MPRSKGEIFVREFVMGIGFLGGLFSRAGINPEREIIKALTSAFQVNSTLFILFSFIITILSLYAAYSLGGVLGLLAILLGFISGYLIFVPSTAGIGALLLIIAVFLGWIAPYKEQYSPYF